MMLKKFALDSKIKIAKFIVKCLFISLVTGFLVLSMVDFFFIPFYWHISPGGALKTFKTRKCVEDKIINPLIISGKRVVPLIIDEIKNKDMNLRGYAIIALGEIGERSALPVLKDIIYDNNEGYIIRLDALRAVALIDYELAKKIAREFYERGYVWIKNDYVRFFGTNDPPAWYFSKKNYWDAWFDRHK